MPKNKYKNIWFDEHPVINYATFEAFPMIVFGHKCISEDYQDGEIWSDEEYWGSTLYDFDDDKYYQAPCYIQSEKGWEDLINRWKQNHEDPSDGNISEDFDSEADIEAINFYKEYLKTDKKQDIEDYYQKVYANKE